MENKNDDIIPYIPYDVYESPQELVIILPLWGVSKDTLDIRLDEYRLVITWERKQPVVKENFVRLKDECYRWKIEKRIDLPAQVYFDRIHSKLRADNTLEIIVPKSIMPEKISLEVEYDD